MEQHPIPQDVTGFQFKLIGSMTVKQFAYVATGVILAVVLYYLPLPGPFSFIAKLILMPLFGGTGFAIAFLPVEGRPVDLMLGNLFRALFSPNQYVYRRDGQQFSFSLLPTGPAKPTQTIRTTISDAQRKKQQQLQAFLVPTPGKTSKFDEKEAAFLQSLALFPSPALTTPTPEPQLMPVAQQPTPQPLPTQPSKTMPVTQQYTQPIQNAPPIQQAATQALPTPQPKTEPLIAPAQPVAQEAHYVRNIPATMSKSAGLAHVSDTPNVVVGIIKDARGNVLPNMLVEVKDKDASPVRAFKTNLLGQFVSATPLAPGTYTIEIEDPKNQHSFDIIQIVANNQIMLPLEIISHDAREELHRQLFAN